METAAISPRTARPGWFRVVAIAFLLWNLVGCYMFWSQHMMTPMQSVTLTPAQKTLWNAIPVWMWGIYAVAVFSGALGALLLLLGKRLALPLFLVSLVAVVVQFAQVFFPGGALELMGVVMALRMPALTAVVALLQLWATHKAIARGWLG